MGITTNGGKCVLRLISIYLLQPYNSVASPGLD